ncbi:MAG: hypothetical protein JOZ14_20205 [Acidobacteria bacterium]|nr:hypothetical protein [Acidobacteriota bacterium]
MCLAARLAPSQVAASSYLLRLEQGNLESHACVLLQNSGSFHLEIDHGDETKVFEGQLHPTQLAKIRQELDDPSLKALEQTKIEEPLVSSAVNDLRINVFRGDHWQELVFKSPESQQPYRRWLQPLVHWLSGLDRTPHRERSEDEGKNNCLPPKKVALKRRNAPRAEPGSETIGQGSGGPATVSPAPPSPPAALLQLLAVSVTSGGAKQKCMLIAEDGRYRFELRSQKSGRSQVDTQVAGGRLTAEELAELQGIVASPTLANIHHHEPPGGLVVRMMRDMVRLWIRRGTGTQEIVLSGPAQRNSGFFYSGDADLGRAQPLFEFLSAHIEQKRGNLDPALRNDCREIPAAN